MCAFGLFELRHGSCWYLWAAHGGNSSEFCGMSSSVPSWPERKHPGDGAAPCRWGAGHGSASSHVSEDGRFNEGRAEGSFILHPGVNHKPLRNRSPRCSSRCAGALCCDWRFFSALFPHPSLIVKHAPVLLPKLLIKNRLVSAVSRDFLNLPAKVRVTNPENT